MPTDVRAAAPPAPPGGSPGPQGQASLDQPQLHPWERVPGCSGTVPPVGRGACSGVGAGNEALAVWPLFIRILVGGVGGFLFEVYDLPAFQDPTTHKFKVAMKFLFLWASQARAF